MNKEEQNRKLFDAMFPASEIDAMIKKRKHDIATATYYFHQRLTILDSHHKDISDQCKPYHVKFYDDEVHVIVRATNFTTAGILAMASRIHDKKSFGIEYVDNLKGVKCPIDIKD